MLTLAKSQKFYGHVFEGETFDCGSKAGFIRANIAYALDDPGIRGEVLSDLKKWVLSRFKLL
jgi:UTP--glucose-1-phosphate uridylyltransferase